MQGYDNRVALEYGDRSLTYRELVKSSDLGQEADDVQSVIVESSTVKRINMEDPIAGILSLLQAMGQGMNVTLEDMDGLTKDAGEYITINPDVASKRTDGPCLLVSSSGSTGGRKCLWRSFASWEEAYGLHMSHFGFEVGTRVWIDGSLTYTGNLHTLLAVFWSGGTVVLTQKANLSKAFGAVSDKGIDIWFMIPSKLEALVRLMVRRHFRSAPRAILTVGEALNARCVEGLSRVIQDTILHYYYGSAELGHVSYRSVRLSDSTAWNPKDVGVPFDEVEWRIDDEGLFRIRSPYDCFGKGNKEFHTSGDRGSVDAGHLILEGRDVSVLNRHGVKIHLDTILEIVMATGLVDDAAIRIKRSGLKTTYDLLIVCDGTQVVKERLMDGIPKDKRPSAIVYVSDIPHNKSGKTRRYIME